MKTKFHRSRRQTAYVSLLGTTQLHLRNPWTIAWWSAAFPGFGHLLLSKYLRGFLLIGWELLINTQAHINLAIVYSFEGKFNLAKGVLEVRWMSLYAPVYLFAIYDSYRTTVDLNHAYTLADREKTYFHSFNIGALEINYLDKRNPWLALVWSLLMPGMGQLYIHRIIAAFYVLAGWISTTYLSHFLEGMQYTLMGNFSKATQVLQGEWLLFMPSIYGFALYDAYTNTVENNKLFDKEQKWFLESNYLRRKDGPMQVVSSFEHSIYLELALAKLEELGIGKEDIVAVPLDKRAEKPKILDTIHRSDGISLIDTGVACATALTVIGSSIGFALVWGPIIWGLIGCGIGFVIGLIIDLLIRKKKPNESIIGESTEVFVLVYCEDQQAEMVQTILWNHKAFGVARIK